jgi:hypothetical protein
MCASFMLVFLVFVGLACGLWVPLNAAISRRDQERHDINWMMEECKRPDSVVRRRMPESCELGDLSNLEFDWVFITAVQDVVHEYLWVFAISGSALIVASLVFVMAHRRRCFVYNKLPIRYDKIH